MVPQIPLCIESWIGTVMSETTTLNHRPGPLVSTHSNTPRGKRKAVVHPSRVNPKRACRQARTITDMDKKRVRGPGRPLKNPPAPGGGSATGRVTARDQNSGQVESRPNTNLTPFPSLPPSEISYPSRPVSPSKKSKGITQPKTDASINMTYLVSCKPSVIQRTVQEVRKIGQLPPTVRELYSSLNTRQGGFIPACLKVSITATSLDRGLIVAAEAFLRSGI